MSVSGNSGGFWRSVRQLPGRTPLRVKLITAVLALVTIALAAISIAGISVLKSYLLDQFDGTLVIGIDVTSVYSTISRLTLIDLIVSVILLAGVAIVGVAVVRASLRPLTDIEQTAGPIAAGDLTRRVPDRDPRTEVGRLGRSLNVMLAQIETAFRARADSEAAARRSEERMRQFVADASHELRTPLTAIRGFAEYYRQRGGLDLSPQGRAPENSTGAPPALAAGGAAAAAAGAAG